MDDHFDDSGQEMDEEFDDSSLDDMEWDEDGGWPMMGEGEMGNPWEDSDSEAASDADDDPIFSAWDGSGVSESIKSQILKCFRINDDEAPSESFATFSTHSDAINPGLDIKGLGSVGLPLSERDAKAITSLCHESPFGKGSETRVDQSVRKTWELNADQFELRNPAWPSFLKKVTDKVGEELNVVGGGVGIRADLYKLLLYDTGAMFKPHKDSEKVPRMFGTLVICLPSKHSGGEIVATHGDQTKTFSTAEVSEFDSSFISWYADVTHEVKAVTAGHRLVLTYNLVQTGTNTLSSAALMTDQKSKLNSTLGLWEDLLENHPDPPRHLVYKLSHKYTPASLRFDNLKGRDVQRMSELKEACVGRRFCLLLANMVRERSGGCGDEYCPDDTRPDEQIHGDFHKLYDVYDDDITLHPIVDLDGVEVGCGVRIEESDIVQKNPFARGPQYEDYSGYTGNEGVSATHFYRNTVAILLSKESKVTFLLEPATRGQQDGILYVQKMLEEVPEGSSDEAKSEKLSKLCDWVLEHNAKLRQEKANSKERYFHSLKKEFSDETLAMVIRAALYLERLALMDKAVSMVTSKLPIWVFAELGKHLDVADFSKCRASYTRAVQIQPKLNDRTLALNTLVCSLGRATEKRPGTTALSTVRSWQKEQLADACDCVSIPTKEEGGALVEVAAIQGDKYLFAKILPLVKQNASDTNFALSFLNRLYEAGQCHEISEKVVENVFRDVLSDVVPEFGLQLRTPSMKRQKIWSGKPSDYIDRTTGLKAFDSLPDQISGVETANFLLVCISMNLDSEIDEILDILKNQASGVDVEAYKDIYLPMLRQLIVIASDRRQLSQERFRSFFQFIVDSYITYYVGMEPARSPDWAREKRGCGCEDCNNLDEFLINPHQKSTRFQMSKARRSHVERRLPYSFGETGYATETERAGNPHTLIVNKTDSEYKRNHKLWETRCSTALGEFRTVAQEPLKLALGERHEELLSLQSVRLGKSRGR